jgi:hypothetical protein
MLAMAKYQTQQFGKKSNTIPVKVDKRTGDIFINVKAGVRFKGGKEATDAA